MIKKCFSRLFQILYRIQVSDFGCWCNYHKLLLVIFFLMIGLVGFILFRDYSSIDTSLLVGIIAACVAYLTHDVTVKMKTLASYNERFCTNEIIKGVTKIIDKRITEKERDNSIVFNDTSEDFNQQKEMFYRFFEELELNIQKGILKKRDVYNLFAYYAIKGIVDDLLPLPDYHENWRLLERFIKRMKSFDQDIKSDC